MTVITVATIRRQESKNWFLLKLYHCSSYDRTLLTSNIWQIALVFIFKNIFSANLFRLFLNVYFLGCMDNCFIVLNFVLRLRLVTTEQTFGRNGSTVYMQLVQKWASLPSDEASLTVYIERLLHRSTRCKDVLTRVVGVYCAKSRHQLREVVGLSLSLSLSLSLRLRPSGL